MEPLLMQCHMQCHRDVDHYDARHDDFGQDL